MYYWNAANDKYSKPEDIPLKLGVCHCVKVVTAESVVIVCACGAEGDLVI